MTTAAKFLSYLGTCFLLLIFTSAWISALRYWRSYCKSKRETGPPRWELPLYGLLVVIWLLVILVFLAAICYGWYIWFHDLFSPASEKILLP